MARIAAGDEAAFQALVEEHAPRLLRLIGRLTAWHADREDLLQETLLTVWEKSHRYDERGTLAGWLTQIALNRVKNRFRALGRLRRCLEGFAYGQLQHMTPSQPAPLPITPSTPLEEADTPLAEALAEMSVADRSLIVLYYLEELPAEEIARLEGIRVDALHVRLSRARNRLKQRLETTN